MRDLREPMNNKPKKNTSIDIEFVQIFFADTALRNGQLKLTGNNNNNHHDGMITSFIFFTKILQCDRGHQSRVNFYCNNSRMGVVEVIFCGRLVNSKSFVIVECDCV